MHIVEIIVYKKHDFDSLLKEGSSISQLLKHSITLNNYNKLQINVIFLSLPKHSFMQW